MTFQLDRGLDLDLDPDRISIPMLPRASPPRLGWGLVFGTSEYGIQTPGGRPGGIGGSW